MVKEQHEGCGPNSLLLSDVALTGGKCPLPGSYCQDISDAFWKKLVDDLTSSSQSIADPTMIDKMVSALNGIFYIFQPKV